MKIALLSEKYTPDIGGLAISTGRLGHLLASAGHEVSVFAPTLHLPPCEKQTLVSDRISVTRFGAHKRVEDTLVDWFELIVAEHKRAPFCLLHAYFLPQAGFIAAYAGKYLNLPSVVSIRGNDVERAAFDPSKFSHSMYALQNASAITTNASELARKARAFIEREINLIPNGIDIDRFKALQRNEVLAESLGLIEVEKREEERMAVVGFAGELREKKGMKVLLSGYTQACRQKPSVLLIIGEVRPGEDKQMFDEFRQANPDVQIVVTGVVAHKDMPAYYSLLDVFVHPSLRDGMPNALLEAMACEKTVIATPVGGTLDVLKDGKNGITVNVNDANMLAEQILEMLDNPEKRSMLGKNARQSIMENYTPEKELEANLTIYRKFGL